MKTESDDQILNKAYFDTAMQFLGFIQFPVTDWQQMNKITKHDASQMSWCLDEMFSHCSDRETQGKSV